MPRERKPSRLQKLEMWTKAKNGVSLRNLVDFNDNHSTPENLFEVMEILREEYEIELEELQEAVQKVFGEDDPDTSFTTSMEEIKSEQEALIVEAVDEAIEAREGKEQMSQP